LFSFETVITSSDFSYYGAFSDHLKYYLLVKQNRKTIWPAMMRPQVASN